MRILVLGGTGFIGSWVVRALSGHDVWVFHRGHTGVELPGVRHVRGDRAELARHRAALREFRPDVVLDMVPRDAVDARTVVDCVAGVAARLVVISSASVYRSFGVMVGSEDGVVDNSPSEEDAPLRRQLFPYRGAAPRAPDDPRRWLDDYDKIPIEREYQQAHGLSCNVVRLPMVYGPGDPDRRFGSYVKRMLDGRQAIVLHEAALSWRNSRAFVSNVADAIACVVERGTPGRVYNVAEPPDLEEGELVRSIGRMLGWQGILRSVAADWGWQARPAIEELPAHTRFTQHLRLDSTRIRRELGFAERVPFAEGLEKTLSELLRAPGEFDCEYEDRLLAVLDGRAPVPANAS